MKLRKTLDGYAQMHGFKSLEGAVRVIGHDKCSRATNNVSCRPESTMHCELPEEAGDHFEAETSVH